jgi:hypothetical protein
MGAGLRHDCVVDEEEDAFIGSTAGGRTVRFIVGRDFGTITGYEVRVTIVEGNEERDWYLDQDQAEGLGRVLLEQASVVRGLDEPYRARQEEWRRQREEGWAEELPKLQHQGFKVETPKLGPVLLVGYLPTGERFVFTCAEKTCRLSLQLSDGGSQEWEEEVVGLEGEHHARWMLPNEAVRVLRSMVKNRPPLLR